MKAIFTLFEIMNKKYESAERSQVSAVSVCLVYLLIICISNKLSRSSQAFHKIDFAIGD